MPLYEYVCQKCNREQELLLAVSDQTPHCEACGSDRLTKLLSVPAAHSAARGGTDQGPPTGACGSGCGCFPG